MVYSELHPCRGPITISGRSNAEEDTAIALGKQLISIPDMVHESRRYPLGIYRGRNFVQVSQIPRRFASGPAGEIPPGESIVERCWRPGSPAEVSLTLFG